MVKAIPLPRLTPADDLRDKLQRAEQVVVNLKGMGPKAVVLLELLDEAQDLITSLEAKGMDLRPERTRLTTVHNQLRSRAAALARELAVAGGLPTLRQNRAPGRDRWWWYLDELVAQRRRRLLRNGIIAGTFFLIVLGVAIVAYDRFLAPDPLTRQKLALIGDAEILLSQGDIPSALEKYQAAHAIDPTDAEVLIWVGVLAQQLGQDTEAENAFAGARVQVGSEVEFLVVRGMTYAMMGQLDAAQSDAKAALALDPHSAEAHFLLGGVYEGQGRNREAIAELQQAADLARQVGNDNLYVLAATRLAMLLQAVGVSPGSE
jgi:tetratricopeptide (TPR) repeat protein